MQNKQRPKREPNLNPKHEISRPFKSLLSEKTVAEYFAGFGLMRFGLASEGHPVISWLHPIAAVLRVWFALSLITQIIANNPINWRGRNEFATTDSKPPQA